MAERLEDALGLGAPEKGKGQVRGGVLLKVKGKVVNVRGERYRWGVRVCVCVCACVCVGGVERLWDALDNEFMEGLGAPPEKGKGMVNVNVFKCKVKVEG